MDNLRLNTKFIGFDGVIGRRDYLLNIAYISIIGSLAALPVTWHLFSNLESFEKLLDIGKLYTELPSVLLVWNFLALAFVSFVKISNIIRRANDILGKTNNIINAILSILLLCGTFGLFFMPIPILAIFSVINTLISLVLFFTKGKITGKMPYDFIKDFNWGAFFGTWLWGLFNSSYKTLWMLLLGLTPAGFYYALVCGLKGNEWAYKGKKWESDEKFKKSQDIQTIIFIILKVVILPMIYFVLVIAFVLCLMLAITGTENKDTATGNPQAAVKIMNAAEKFTTFYSSIFFEKYEISENENKFYVLPSDWAGYSFGDKKDLMESAATTSAMQKLKKNPKGHYSKRTELPKTKIYSTKNNELLGEFAIDESINSKNANFKTALKAALSAYKFYKPTEK